MKIKNIPQTLLDEYRKEEISFETLAKRLKICRTTLTKFFKEHSLKTNKVLKREQILHEYFNEMKIPKKLYLLGYYIADGCSYVQNNNKMISFGCTEEDIELLNFVKKELNIPYKLKKSKSYKIKNTSYLSKPMISIAFTSSKIFDFLSMLGVGERKSSLNFQINDISDELFKFLILGFFDGDGSVGISKVSIKEKYTHNNVWFRLTSKSKLFLEQVQDYFSKHNIKTHLKYFKGKDIWEIHSHSKKELLKLKNLLYDGHVLGLKRKREIFYKI